MPLIEGVGDEVIQFAVAMVLITVSTLAWWSTNARPDRYRSVVVMRSQAQHPVSVSIRTGGEPRVYSANPRTTRTTIHASTTAAAVSLARAPTTVAPNENRAVIPLQEMDSIIDADVALFNHTRMHFYRRMENLGIPDPPNNTPAQREDASESETEDTPASEPASTEQMREMDNIVNAMRGDINGPCFTQPGADTDSNPTTPVIRRVSNVDPTAVDSTGSSPIDLEETNRRKILIKLKYLNDTQKEVEGSLDELLKDFKWRHFNNELTEHSAVRLIYQGHVLDESRTLRACGLHDQAVVHALVHPRRAQLHQVTEESIGAPLEIIHERVQPERSWDLENILMTLVSVALTIVWFFRCEYSNMFTASASVALFGLTVFYSVAIFGLYISDTFQIDRRNQNVPTN